MSLQAIAIYCLVITTVLSTDTLWSTPHSCDFISSNLESPIELEQSLAENFAQIETRNQVAIIKTEYDMESVGDGWRSELKKYFRSVECLTENALLLIKRDRIRNDLPFDEPFMKYFLDRTNSRIANVYMEFVCEERFEMDVNRQINGDASLKHQSTSTAVNHESIDQVPSVQPKNQNSTPNPTSSTSFVPDDNQMSNQIVIPTPSNQLRLQVGNNRSNSQEASAQNTDSIAEGKELRKEITDKTIESNPNKDNSKNSAVGSGRAMVSTSSGANRSKYEESLERMTSTQLQPETIDLTSDQEDLADSLDSDQNIAGQTHSNVRQRKACEALAAGNSKQTERFRISLHGGTHLQNNKSRIAQRAEPDTSLDRIDRNSEQQSIGTNVIPNHKTVNHEKNEDELARTNENLDQSSANGASANPHVNGQLEPVVPSGRNRETNFARMSSDENNDHDYAQGLDDGNALATDKGISKDRGGNDVSRSVGYVAGPSQPTIIRRERGNDSAMVNGHLKKKPKLADAVETKKRHKCDYCDYSTEHRGTLTRHIRMHTNERPYECTICYKRFTQKPNLNRHMKTHCDSIQFRCSTCRQGFSDEMKWESHERRCKAKQYECHLCKKIVHNKQHLVDHMRAHTGEKLRCPKCRKKFSSNQSLARHIKSHGKLFRFQCSNCRQGFSDKKSWKLHESRCKSKQYECFLCGYKFHQFKSNLLVHMRHKHTGEKRFGCSDCPMRFCQKVQLTNHTKRCHLNGN